MSLTLLILKINATFEDVQMMLEGFFYFSTGFRFSKISVECSVHICSCPWIDQFWFITLLLIYLLFAHTNSTNFVFFWILTIIFILVWVLIVSSIKIVFFIIFVGMVENAHQWMWIYSTTIHTFFFAIIFECLRWSPYALNSWVVSWITWLNSLENYNFFQKMTEVFAPVLYTVGF